MHFEPLSFCSAAVVVGDTHTDEGGKAGFSKGSMTGSSPVDGVTLLEAKQRS